MAMKDEKNPGLHGACALVSPIGENRVRNRVFLHPFALGGLGPFIPHPL